MSYVPNLKDPRVLKRIAEVLQWSKLMLTPLGGAPISKATLDAVFGPSGNSLSKYLRSKLLVQTASYLVGEVSKSYALNHAGMKSLKALFVEPDLYSTYMEPARKTNALVSRHTDELASLSFTYTESSDRHWHPLQNIRRGSKDDFWAEFGLPYDYDIEACAPTVLMALALKYDLPKIVLAGLNDYLTNKKEFREYVQNLTGLEAADTKKLVNSLFNGARLIPHYACSAYVLLGYDRERLQTLKDDSRVKELRASVRRVWQRLGYQLNRSFAKGAEKWALYFKWERQIMDIVRDHLNQNGVKFFTEHDGFRTNVPVDVNVIEEAIRVKTGFKVKLQSSHINSTTQASVEYKSGADSWV